MDMKAGKMGSFEVRAERHDDAGRSMAETILEAGGQVVLSSEEPLAGLVRTYEECFAACQRIIERAARRRRSSVADRVARSVLAAGGVGTTARLTRDANTKVGAQFKAGETLRVDSYSNAYPYTVRLSAPDGRKLSLMVERAWMTLEGFPKPPGMATMQRWSMDGVARAVDGARTEPDGFSPSGAPSWVLVMGLV